MLIKFAFQAINQNNAIASVGGRDGIRDSDQVRPPLEVTFELKQDTVRKNTSWCSRRCKASDVETI